MAFLLSKLLWNLARPSGLLLVLAAIGLLLAWTRRRRLSRGLLLLGIGGLLAQWLLPLDQWAVRPLEDRFPRPAPPPHVDGIIMLGGAIDGLVTADRGVVTFSPAGERITEFVTLARRYPDAKLAFTGGSGDPLGEIPAEAGPMRALLADLGLPVDRMVFEGASRTTWENAVFSYRLLRPKPGEVWLMVTSASHMPRAVGAFRAAGWHVVPWPVGYKSTRDNFWHWVAAPLGDRMALFDWAIHEWVGLVAYRLLCHSSALFPAPEAAGQGRR